MGETQAPVIPAAGFQPNLKFKVMDKEHEIPEYLRDAIKDADTEKQVKEIFEKAYGLDVVKPRFQEVREKYRALETEHKNLNSSLTELGRFVREGDMNSFFGALKINDEKVFKYVLDKLNYNSLPPEQKAEWEQQQNLKQRAYMLERQNQQLVQQQEHQSVQVRTTELQTVLSRQDVKSAADLFDSQVGKPGAFFQEVVNRGKLAWHTTGQDISAEQAVNEVLGLVKPFLGAHGATGANQGQVSGAAATPPQSQQPPVIPNVAGRSTSPAKKQPRSIADLRKLGNSM